MSITLELTAEVEHLAKAKAEAKGISLEEYLPPLLAQALQEEDWKEDSASQMTIMGMEPTLRRLWDTPEEDEAWKDL
jgi:hypothetical protein